MKILVVAPDFYPTNGGYANAIGNFVNEMGKDGELEVLIYTPIALGKMREINIPRVSFIRCPAGNFLLASGIWEIKSYFKIKTILKKENIDCIFFETAEFGLLGYLLSYSFKNILVRIHACTETEVAIWGAGFYNRYRSYFVRAFFKKVRWVISTNSYHIQFYKEFFLGNNIYEVAKRRFFVIPNIVYRDETNIEKKVLLDKYVDTERGLMGKKIFFTLGRLNSVGLIQKGIEDLLYAVALLKQEVPEKTLQNICIFVVGEGEYKMYIRNLAKRLGINQFFIFIDKVEHRDILGFLRISNGTILLSRFEGLSMFALEALAQGSPLLLSKGGGLADLVVDGRNGFFIEPQNIESIKNSLNELINLCPEDMERMQEQSLRIYHENFSPADIVKKFKFVVELLRRS